MEKSTATIAVVLIGLAAALLAALFYGAPSALQAHASRRLPQAVWWRVLVAALRDRMMLSVLVLYLVGAAANYVAIQTLPLYLAQAATSVSLIFTALASAWWLGEWPFAHQWTALVAVVLGLALLATGAGKAGGQPDRPHLVLGLYAGLVVSTAIGFSCRWLTGHFSGVMLGLFAGVSFAGVPLGTRLLDAPYWELRTVAVIAVIACYGIVGFALSTISLARVQVNTATAPLILSQTLIPAVLGIAVFGDQVRSDWGWAIVLGLVLSMLGTIGVSAIARPLAEEAAEKVEA